MSKPTLVVLAAGMGSRYGSLKQMDGLGPNNEAIIDYSIYDAIRAGFGKVVFVIRHSFETVFREIFSVEKFDGQIEVEFVFQELDNLPEGISVPEGREKPWGTNHALMMAESVVNEPFAVINADDFYGADAYMQMSKYLQSVDGEDAKYSMVGYYLKNTLSENGTVSRGVCLVDDNSNLTSIVERTSIDKKDGSTFYTEDGVDVPLDENCYVSMNMFGFTPDYFVRSNDYFRTFLAENSSNLKAEFFIPLMVNKLIEEKSAELKVLASSAQWFGVTYKEDRASVVAKINDLIEQGIYPAKLWK